MNIKNINDKIEKSVEAKHKHLRKEFEEFKFDVKTKLNDIESKVINLDKLNSNQSIFFDQINKNLEEINNQIKDLTKTINNVKMNFVTVEKHKKDVNEIHKILRPISDWKIKIGGILAIALLIITIFKDEIKSIL